MENKKFIVYIHISPSNKKYVGITSRSPNQRWNNGKGYKNNEHFYNSIQKYGWNNFKHIIVAENLSKEEACELEIKLIKKFNTQDYHFGYNNTSGGEHTTFSNESKKKMSESKKGYIPSQATIEKLCRTHGEILKLKKGAILVDEHSTHKTLYVYYLAEGICSVSGISSNGREQIFLYQTAGEMLGHVPYIMSENLNSQ